MPLSSESVSLLTKFSCSSMRILTEPRSAAADVMLWSCLSTKETMASRYWFSETAEPSLFLNVPVRSLVMSRDVRE
ncbi:hypothetical protein D3C87_1221530 [compost metagenome]